MDKIWTYGETSLTLDMADAATVERYEDAFDQLAKEAAALPKDGRASARIRAYCAMYRRLFDRLFGEGTADVLFRDIPDNTDRYDEVYGAFLQFIAAQTAAITKQKEERAAQIRRFLPDRSRKKK